MKVSINGKFYEDVEWFDSSLRMETEMSLAEAEQLFAPDSKADIVVYDGETQIAKYINKGIKSLNVQGSNPRVLTITFDVTQFSDDAKEEIQESLDTSDGAIAELAEIVASISEIDFDHITEELQSHQETINTWFGHFSEIINFINLLREDGGILDQFDIRIRALESNAGIISIEQNEEQAGEQ